MSSEGEAEAAAESGPGSTPAPGPAAAVREEVSGSGGACPTPGRAGRTRGAKAAPPRGRVAGRAWRNTGEPRREEGAPAGDVSGAEGNREASHSLFARLPAAAPRGQPPAAAVRCSVRCRAGAVPGWPAGLSGPAG